MVTLNSRFRCFGDENLIQEFTERACVFENVCYNMPSGQFRFYRRPDSVPKPLFFDEVERELFEFHSKVSPAGLLGVFAAMVRLNVRDDNAVPIWIRGNLPDRPLWRKFIAGFFPAVTSHPIVTIESYAREHATEVTENICFDELMVGGNIRRFIRSAQHHNIGHEPILLEFRDRVLLKHQIAPNLLPKRHRIVVSHKKRGASGRTFANEDEMVAFLKQTWPTVQLDVICFSDYSITEQLQIFTDTTILITHAGGGSAMLPFLPDGAHAIILDYLAGGGGPVIDNDVPGHSVSMEGALWNYWPHVKKLYYQINSPEELRVDNPNIPLEAADWRSGVSIQIDMGRVKVLVEAAFENMAP
ncbi:hypothetical protein HDU89_003664 [Geranomyces variabilis]|nr:hypothetical protein HDU89_003664 [Geranomyces variabilis]